MSPSGSISPFDDIGRLCRSPLSSIVVSMQKSMSLTSSRSFCKSFSRVCFGAVIIPLVLVNFRDTPRIWTHKFTDYCRRDCLYLRSQEPGQRSRDFFVALAEVFFGPACATFPVP